MKYAIVYSSLTGNTKLLAETLAKALSPSDCIYCGKPDPKALGAERIYIGFWTDKGSCNSETADFLKSVIGQELFLFGTAGFGGSKEYYNQILSRTKKLIPNTARCIGSFMCQGKMPLSVRQRYEAMGQSPGAPANIQAMIENFDKALSHPDPDDLQDFISAVQTLN